MSMFNNEYENLLLISSRNGKYSCSILTRVETLIWVILEKGKLFRVGTPCNNVALQIISFR